MTGADIRRFLRELFGSRLVIELQEQLVRVTESYETRLTERDQMLADYRDQLAQAHAKLERYECVLLPLTSPAGDLFTHRRKPPTFESVTEAPPIAWSDMRARLEQELVEEIAKKEVI